MRAIDIDVNNDSENDVVDTLFVNLDDLLPQNVFTTPVTYRSFPLLLQYNTELSVDL